MFAKLRNLIGKYENENRNIKNAKKRNNPIKSRELRIESLEQRKMLSISPSLGFSSPVYDANGALPVAIETLRPQSAPPFSYDKTFKLHSNPDADLTIYLDFNGHTTKDTPWNYEFAWGNTITTTPYSIDSSSAFSNAELQNIQYIWQRVSEDFLPFNVNVTTEEPSTLNGVRVAIGGSCDDWLRQSAGGIAYMDSFSWDQDVPCFVFPQDLLNGNEKYVAEAISHEVGHTLGLNHDGYSRGGLYEEYYSGSDGWAPIMGLGYYQELVQWSRGEYTGASNTEDDLSILTRTLSYRNDDHGNSVDTATKVSLVGSGFSSSGIIERNTDVDFFEFTLTQKTKLDISITPGMRDANLDVLAKLYDSSGTTYHTSDPYNTLSAGFTQIELDPGTWYFSVEGTGRQGVYSDYGSLGSYTIVGTLSSGGTQSTIDPPTDFRTTNQSSNSVSLQWTAPSEVGRYVLQYRKVGTTNWITDPAPNPNATTTTVNGLVHTSDYVFRLKAVKGSIESDWVETEGSTTPLAPTIPTNFRSINQTPNSVTLSWKAPNGATGYVLEYRKSGTTEWTPVVLSNETETTINALDENTQYNFRIKATGEGGESPWATCNAKTGVTAPDVPAGFTTTGQTANSISLQWTAIPGVERYILQYRKVGTTNWITAPAPTPNSTTTMVNGLVHTTDYTFRLKAVKGGIESDWAETEGSTTPTAPTVPTNFRSTTQTPNSVTLSWQAPNGATGYVLEYRKSGVTEWTPVVLSNETETTINALDENTQYNFRIKATGEGGESPWATCNAKTGVTAPDAPAGFTTTGQTANSISLEWTAISGVERYVLQYRKVGTSNWTTAPAPNINSTTTTVNGLVHTTDYTFRLKAVKGGLESDWAETEGSTTPTAPTVPTNFKSTIQTPNSVTLSWNTPDGATGYVLEYRKSGATEWTPVVLSNETEATINSLDENTQYNFRIKATGDGGESPWATCNAKTGVTAPDAPAGFSTTDQSSNSVSLQWTATPGVDRYILQYRKVGTSNWIIAPAPSARSDTATVYGLAHTSDYVFRLKSVRGGFESNWSEVETTTKPLPPTVATNFRATEQTPDSIALSWKAPTRATGFVLEYRKNGATNWIPTTVTVDETQATISDLEENTLYHFRVKATGDGGESPWASCSAKTTVTPPEAPAGFRTTNQTRNSVSLEWTASPGAERYVLQYRKADVKNWITAPASAPKSTTATIHGLLQGTNYEIRIKAVKTGAESDWSEIETQTAAKTSQGIDAPEAMVLCQSTTVQEGCGIIVTAMQSEDSVEYLWDIDGDGIYETEGTSVWFSTNNISGKPQEFHTIHHKVRNDAGVESEPVSCDIQILASPPTLDVWAPSAEQLKTNTRLSWGLTAYTNSYRPIMDWIINWGDGSHETEILGGPRNDVMVSHNYRHAGEYTITVTTTDFMKNETVMVIGTYTVTETELEPSEYDATEAAVDVVSENTQTETAAYVPEEKETPQTEPVSAAIVLSESKTLLPETPLSVAVPNSGVNETMQQRQMLDLDLRNQNNVNDYPAVIDHLFVSESLFETDMLGLRETDDNSDFSAIDESIGLLLTDVNKILRNFFGSIPIPD